MVLTKSSLKQQIGVLVTVWILFQFFFFYHFGIVTAFESSKYINQANIFLNTGHYATGNFLFYSVEILLIAVSKSTQTFPWLPVSIQLLVNAFSIFCFYKLCLAITKDSIKAFIITLLFECMFYYHLYNVHLFTESLYYSFSIIYTFLLFSVRKLSLKTILLLFLGLSLLYFTRPTGLFFIPSTVVFLVFKFYRKRAVLILSGLLIFGLICFYFLLNFSLRSGGELDFLLPYIDERIICGVPTIQTPHVIKVPGEKNSVEGLWYVITHYPSLFFGLAWRRWIAFFGVTRSYFTLAHNLFIAAYFYAAYILGLFGLRKMIASFLPLTAFLFCNILLVMVTVVLSCDEWHNRFILALLPFFLLLASGAFIPKSKEHAEPGPVR